MTVGDCATALITCEITGSGSSSSAFGLPQHPDDHRPERPILLAVDQQFGEGAFAALTDSTYGTVTFSVSTPVFVFLNLPSNDRMCWPADSGSRT